MLKLRTLILATPPKIRNHPECRQLVGLPKIIGVWIPGEPVPKPPEKPYVEVKARVNCHAQSMGQIVTPGRGPMGLRTRMLASRVKTCTFRFYDKPGVDSRVWCSCNCPMFLYYLEVALTLRGSSSILYSNGRVPKITNPSMKPSLCKHLIQAASDVVKSARQSGFDPGVR